MKIHTYLFAAFTIFSSAPLKAQFAPDSFQGIVLQAIATKTPPYPYNQTLGKTTVAIMARTGTTYSTYLEGNNEVIQTGVSYTYAKQSPNVGKFTVWIPSLLEYATTFYTFTSPDAGTLTSTTSIGVIEGTFKLYKTWSWQDQVDHWNQATEAQTSFVLEDPSRLGLYNQADLNSAVTQAREGLFSKAQLDQAVINAKAGLFTKEQLDAAVEAATVTNVYFKTNEEWELQNNPTSFSWKLQRSADLEIWQTVGESEVELSGEGHPLFIKIEIE